MARWFVVCVLLAIGSFVLMIGVAGILGGTDFAGPARADKPARQGHLAVDAPATYVDCGRTSPGGLQPLIIQEARLLSAEKVDVPTEREGKLVCIATEIKHGEIPRPDKILEDVPEFGFLAIEVQRGEQVPAKVKRFTFREHQDKVYRPVDEHGKTIWSMWSVVPIERGKVYRPVDEKTDVLLPDRVILVRQRLTLRKLELGEPVKRGQLLAIINPQLALEELASKMARLDAAEADRRASEKTKLESQRRVESMDKSRVGSRSSVSDDDYHAGVLAVARYHEEERSKRMLVGQAQAELKAALTTLKLHEVRSANHGVLKELYKQPGEGVKVTEPVLQIQNPRMLRFAGFTEVQNLRRLKYRLDRGRTLYQQAQQDLAKATNQAQRAAARQLEQDALQLTEVIVEPSQPVPPLAVLRGHLNKVTCVAVTRGSTPLIVSGGEDKWVRIWEPVGEQPHWHHRHQLDHHAEVKAVACTGPQAKRNLLLTGTANGQGRLFDLKSLGGGEVLLKGRHSQAINCVAFNPEGTICLTGGEDRTINVWNTRTGELIAPKTGAHKNGVTALQFITDKEFLSVGRDSRMLVWTLGEDKNPPRQIDEFDRRSNEVPVLSVSPDGKQVLFDDARELRLLSLTSPSHDIEGTLQNPTNAPNFSTLALFAPNGKTILTNGEAPGRLQLWRTPRGNHGGELRQFTWTTGKVTCGVFSPDGRYAITGTEDNQVLVWKMPDEREISEPLRARLTYVDEFVDSSLKRVTIRAEMEKPDWVILGGTATIVIPQIVIPVTKSH